MGLSKKEAIEKFCALSRRVMEKHFKYQCAADCFCGKNTLDMGSYQFDEEIISFIENAVNEKINRRI